MLTQLFVYSINATGDTPKFDKALKKGMADFSYTEKIQALGTILFYKALATKSNDPLPLTTDLVISNLLTDKYGSLTGVAEELDNVMASFQGTDRSQKQLSFLQEKYKKVLEKLPTDKRFFYGTELKLPATI